VQVHCCGRVLIRSHSVYVGTLRNVNNQQIRQMRRRRLRILLMLFVLFTVIAIVAGYFKWQIILGSL
jgi:type IV secretory pathway component VirB8